MNFSETIPATEEEIKQFEEELVHHDKATSIFLNPFDEIVKDGKFTLENDNEISSDYNLAARTSSKS